MSVSDVPAKKILSTPLPLHDALVVIRDRAAAAAEDFDVNRALFLQNASTTSAKNSTCPPL